MQLAYNYIHNIYIKKKNNGIKRIGININPNLMKIKRKLRNVFNECDSAEGRQRISIRNCILINLYCSVVVGQADELEIRKRRNNYYKIPTFTYVVIGISFLRFSDVPKLYVDRRSFRRSI